MSDIPITLDNAYNLQNIQQTKLLYRQWAKDYDDSFGAQMGYVAPARVAEVFKNEADSLATPVLDVGAGRAARLLWTLRRRALSYTACLQGGGYPL